MSLFHEQQIALVDVPNHLPMRRGKRIHLATVWRWAMAGVRGGIKLEIIAIGGTRYTSIEALHRFCEATTGKPASRSSRQREKAVAAAERECEAAGV